MRKLESNGDFLIGRSAKSGKLLHYDGAAHLLTMAPTRSGKGVGTIIPNLLLLDRSVICIDPKGRVWCLDPFGVSGQPPARYNPLDRLDTYARWLRLLVSQAVTAMARSTACPVRPVLFLLDQFAALGH